MELNQPLQASGITRNEAFPSASMTIINKITERLNALWLKIDANEEIQEIPHEFDIEIRGFFLIPDILDGVPLPAFNQWVGVLRETDMDVAAMDQIIDGLGCDGYHVEKSTGSLDFTLDNDTETATTFESYTRALSIPLRTDTYEIEQVELAIAFMIEELRIKKIEVSWPFIRIRGFFSQPNFPDPIWPSANFLSPQLPSWSSLWPVNDQSWNGMWQKVGGYETQNGMQVPQPPSCPLRKLYPIASQGSIRGFIHPNNSLQETLKPVELKVKMEQQVDPMEIIRFFPIPIINNLHKDSTLRYFPRWKNDLLRIRRDLDKESIVNGLKRDGYQIMIKSTNLSLDHFKAYLETSSTLYMADTYRERQVQLLCAKVIQELQQSKATVSLEFTIFSTD